MLSKTHSLPFPFLFFCPNADLSRAAAEGHVSPVIPGGRRHPVILTERSEWKDLLLFGSLLHQKRNGKPLMLIKTHSLPFPFLFYCSTLARRTRTFLTPQAYFLSPRAAVERSVRKGRFLGSGPPDLRSERQMRPQFGMTSQHPPSYRKSQKKQKPSEREILFPVFLFSTIRRLLYSYFCPAEMLVCRRIWFTCFGLFVFLFIFAYE